MIGLLPAAGNASRIYGLPKYLLPLPGGYLLQRHTNLMKDAGMSTIMVGTNPDNIGLIYDYVDSDVFVYLANQRETMTETVLSSGYQMDAILFGMPDTYIEDVQVYQKLHDAIEDGADVAVALFKARPDQHQQGGMCRVANGRIINVVDKPKQTDLEYIWGALAWRPVFWDYLKPDDPHVGYALPRAIAAGLDVRAVMCEGNYWDCGTTERYFECIRAMETETA